MTDAAEWISITEAAARLCASGDVVDRSTLSRYLKQHADAIPQKPDGRQTLVDLDALKAHRGENVRLRTVASTGRPSSASQGRVAGSQSDGMARRANADADLKEMELAKKRGQLTVTSEVGQAAADAVALMQSSFDRAVDGAAAATSVRFGWDERKLRLEFKTFARLGLEAFNRAIRERLDHVRRQAMAEEIDQQGAAFGAETAGALQ